MSTLKPGIVVIAKNDGDGAHGKRGIVFKVYKSGRVRVDFTDGSIRNLKPSQVEVVE